MTVREDDLLPSPLRMMTSDGLRFVSSFGGMLNVVTQQVARGGPHAARWSTAAAQTSAALGCEDEAHDLKALAVFYEAARLEGWSIRSS
jgi:hypothetical protein